MKPMQGRHACMKLMLNVGETYLDAEKTFKVKLYSELDNNKIMI